MLTWRHVGLHVKSPNYFEVMMWPQFKCSFGFNKSTPSLWGVSKSKPLAPAHHLLYATAPPKPSIIFVLRHCASPPAARRCISHSVSFMLASGCSLSLRASCRSSPSSSSVAASRLRLFVVAFDYATFGLLLGLSTSPRTPVASLLRGARPIARPFSSPAFPSPLSCFGLPISSLLLPPHHPSYTVEEIRSKGQEPYAYKWDRTHSANQLQDIYKSLGNGEESSNEEDLVSIVGRIVAHNARDAARTYDAAAILMSGENAKTNSNRVMQVELGKKNAQPPPPSMPLSPSLQPSRTPQSSSTETSQSDVANLVNNGMEEEDMIALQMIEELLNRNCSNPSTSSGDGSFQA
ncbi:hypothetical protein Syun_027397 [Stephania yunnanensis]|uniref:Uncharacterized protein n=1 Tax=Stephania yunnanensis TaxID=152371 RepID=A0AAP0EFM0_9MAGN